MKEKVGAVIGLTAVCGFVAAVVLALAFPRVGLALDPRGAKCGAALVGTIRDQFELDRGSDFKTMFPKAGYSPELENSDPLFVVVYDGVTRAKGMAAAPPRQSKDGGAVVEAPGPELELYGVVCVVGIEIGRIVYSDLDTSR